MFNLRQTGDVKQASKDANNNPLRLYDKIRVLGRGSYGLASVHRRRHDRSLVVLKEIDLLRFKDEHERVSAINEVEIMSSLDHPNIIKYFNAYATDSKLVIEMEYANFGTLSAYLSLQNLLEESEILIIFKQITCGLEYLHSKDIIHLDLKMENIFLTNEGLIKIGDFGIAKHMTGAQLGGENPPVEGQNPNRKQADLTGGTFQCTLAFSSPERCLGHPTCFKSDIWSLGCILYELITSKPLFSATSIAQLILNITHISYTPINRPIEPKLEETFQSMIKAKPEERPTASQLVKVIEELINDSEAHKRKALAPSDHLKPLPVKTRRRTGSLLTQNRATMDARDNMSSELIWRPDLASDQNTNHLFYPHSIIYQVSLAGPSVVMNRIQMPQCKRIRQLVRGGTHYLALTYDFIVLGWGSRHRGQLGGCNLSRTPTVTPADESCVKRTILDRRCTLDLSRAEFTSTNQASHRFDISDPDMQITSKPFVISELNHRKISQVAAGKNFSVFLSKTGIVMTCGQGSSGCLGNGQLDDRNKPQMVESLLNKDVVYIAAGSNHVVAVCGNGHAYAWGRTSYGRLGLELDAQSRADQVSLPEQVKFPSKVVIKSAYCGPKATIFIDSKHRCWSCGLNKHNRLGLDQVRRFKRTRLVEEAWTPQEIVCLAKVDIVSCSIGANHCTFLTSDSKMHVLGKDIDCPLGSDMTPASNLSGPMDRVSSLFSEYQGVNKLNQQYKLVDQKMAPTDELVTEPKVAEETTMPAGDRKSGWFTGYNRATASEQQEKRNCLARKAPIEMVQSIAIGNKFSLASTRDNKVYFWGTRSYCQEGTFRPKSYAPEPQLISNLNDDCLIKIATTNQSFMDTIQEIGSDYPILHTQDPRLVINNMSEMWILDHQSSNIETLSNFSSSSSDCQSSTRCSNSMSDCSTCCSLCSHSSTDQSDLVNVTKRANKIRHDVILEPQTILSLYVPAAFNHPGNTLRIAKIYCFDEDRFYLVLETTIKNSNNHPSRSLITLSTQALSSKPKRNLDHPNLAKTRIDSFVGQSRRTRYRRTSLPVELDKSPREISRILQEERIKVSSVVGSADQAQILTKKPDQNQTPDSAGGIYGMTEQVSPTENDSAIEKIQTTISSAGDDDVDTDDEPTQVGNIVVGSSLGMSLDEPRSLSTFANNSNETQIVIGPRDKRNTMDQALKPITKSSILGFSKRLRRKRRERDDIKSESTTGNEADETSAMPSWVINEFMENQHNISESTLDRNHKRDKNRDQSKRSTNDETIFQIESSTEVPIKGDDPSSLGTDHTEIGHDTYRNPSSHGNGQAMVLTGDIPEVIRPRAKSFGESIMSRDQASVLDQPQAGRSRPTSLHISQQWQSSNEYLSSCGYDPNMSWLPSGMDHDPKNSDGQKYNLASQSSNPQQRVNPVTSLRRTIIKLFR